MSEHTKLEVKLDDVVDVRLPEGSVTIQVRTGKTRVTVYGTRLTLREFMSSVCEVTVDEAIE